MVSAISGDGRALSMPFSSIQNSRLSPNGQRGEVSADGREAEAKGTQDPSQKQASGGASKPLSQEEEHQVVQMQERDREVRQHEAAHLAAAGPYARSGARYTYQTGPDGKQYAVGGEVQLDTGKEAKPQQTITKAQTVRGAAMAPASPSSQDLAVANEMSRMEMDARRELQQTQAQAAAQPMGGQAPSTGTGSDGKGTTPSVPAGSGGASAEGNPAETNRMLTATYSRSSASSKGGFLSVLG
jgi:hypothetical protein